MDAALKKQNGIHYTPSILAGFLARQTAACIRPAKLQSCRDGVIRILDPACGDGELLAALIEAIGNVRSLKNVSLEVHGFDTDPDAVAQTKERISSLVTPRQISRVDIRSQDFLTLNIQQPFDCIISNPPYVRTQVLGGAAAQKLAKDFGLTGRVDLYQAFTMATCEALCENGAMGLLTSNRFLTVKSGQTMRRLLCERFELESIVDLGDTRLFSAAVLPVVISGVKKSAPLKSDTSPAESNKPTFQRVYQIENTTEQFPQRELIDAIEDSSFSGEFQSEADCFRIERGTLNADQPGAVWTLSNNDTRVWLNRIRAKQTKTFGELAQIKVGIKTTADAVFIRERWKQLDPDVTPEQKLRVPLITHHVAARWKMDSPQKTVLYPYKKNQSKRVAIDLSKHPRAAAYFETHRDRLEGRKYVIDSGREWFEIWVPHQPADWAKPKIVWPDISDEPKFFLDSSGAIVNGDCYWSKLRDGVDEDWIYLMLAVANSTLATKFYDTVFHNKLYAGRRRFMTQYVNEFPLPDLHSKISKKIIRCVKRLVETPSAKDTAKVESWVWEAFGFDEPQ